MSESLTGLGLRSLFRSFSATLVRQLVAGLVQLCTVALIARFYGPGGNGSFAVALLIPGLLTTFLNLGLAPANVYFLGSGQVSARAVLLTCCRLTVWLSVFGLLAGAYSIYAGADLFFPGIQSQMLWFALISFPPSLLQSLIASIFQGLQKFREYNIVLLAQPLLTLLAVLLLVLFGDDNLVHLVAAYFAGVFLALLVSLWLVKPFLAGRGSEQPAHYAGQALNYGYKAHLSNILTFLNYKADIFLVNFLINPAAAGVYVVAVQLSERLWMLSKSISTVLLPRLSQLSADEGTRRQLTPLISRLVLIVTLLLSVIVSIIGYPFIALVFGDQFLDAFIPLVILLPGIIAGSSSRVLANDIAARGRPELNMYTSVLVVFVNITGNLFLIPHYGLPGAAAATTFAYLLNLLMRALVYRTLTGAPVFSLLVVLPDDLRSLAAAIKGRNRRAADGTQE